MNALLFTLGAVVALGVLAALYRWLQHRRRHRQRMWKAEGYGLINALNSYSAWLDCLPSEPLMESIDDQLAWPEVLQDVCEVTRLSFPALLPQMQRLLEGDSRLRSFMRKHEVRRLSQPAPLGSAARNPAYQRIRDNQESLIEEMVRRCREAIGDSTQAWRRTGAEFDFSSGSGFQTPVTSG